MLGAMVYLDGPPASVNGDGIHEDDSICEVVEPLCKRARLNPLEDGGYITDSLTPTEPDSPVEVVEPLCKRAEDCGYIMHTPTEPDSPVAVAEPLCKEVAHDFAIFLRNSTRAHYKYTPL